MLGFSQGLICGSHSEASILSDTVRRKWELLKGFICLHLALEKHCHHGGCLPIIFRMLMLVALFDQAWTTLDGLLNLSTLCCTFTFDLTITHKIATHLLWRWPLGFICLKPNGVHNTEQTINMLTGVHDKFHKAWIMPMPKYKLAKLQNELNTSYLIYSYILFQQFQLATVFQWLAAKLRMNTQCSQHPFHFLIGLAWINSPSVWTDLITNIASNPPP